MLREVFNMLMREVSTSKLQFIPKNFYDAALSYIQSLKIRVNNEVNPLQRKVWEEEVKVIEKCLKKLRDIRLKKAVKSMLEGEVINPDVLPPEEVFYYEKMREALDLAIDMEKVQIHEDEGKMLLMIKTKLEEALVKKLNLPELEAEDVIFINKQTGRLLINLGLAEEINVR
ncbi:MAG: hypothetical protein DRJ60_03975 [Thermoprotei archaeon]|nr:MAG: hypothetical protein DRJ60_03975 [Thermoprotei archaeon]